MKKTILFLLLALPILLNAQLTFELKGTVAQKISSDIDVGKAIELLSINHIEYGTKTVVVSYDGKRTLMDFGDLEKIAFLPTNLREFWQLQGITGKSYENILKKGLQYKLRKELEEEALEFLKYTQTSGLIYNESYLKSYIYSLIYKIYPDRLNDGRPGHVNVHVFNDLSPNAFIFPNGSLFISTGLLSTIHSEEELIGVLAHEVAHFILDHSILNINQAVTRQKQAEFWTSFATGIAAATDGYIALKNQNYIPGSLTISTAILATSILESVNQRFGMQYSRQQELDADKCAKELLKFLKIDTTALSSVLAKIKEYCVISGEYIALSSEGTHPSIDERIHAMGKPGKFYNAKYDQKISFVNSLNAVLEFNSQRFTMCKTLIDRNILAEVATEEDYLMLAMINIYMYDNEEKNAEALQLINQAKQINSYPTFSQSKQEAIVLIRLNKNTEAKACLLKYRESVDKESAKLEKIVNQGEWSLLKGFLENEYQWTQNMINKVSKL